MHCLGPSKTEQEGSALHLNLSSFIVPRIKQSRSVPGACSGESGETLSRMDV